jgi:hypothetical protein
MYKGPNKPWHPVDFLEFWVDENIDQQPANPKVAHELAKRFSADAAKQGFTLAHFNFDDVTLMRHMIQSMAAPRV